MINVASGYIECKRDKYLTEYSTYSTPVNPNPSYIKERSLLHRTFEDSATLLSLKKFLSVVLRAKGKIILERTENSQPDPTVYDFIYD